MNIRRRLDQLERIWPTDLTEITETDISHLLFWSGPIFPQELHYFVGLRAHYRHDAEVGDGGWFSKLTSDQRNERVQFEYDELARLQALHGKADGYIAWHDQVKAWPQGRHGPCDYDEFERRLLDRYSAADPSRAHSTCPLWRRVWPEWKPNMSPEEHAAFDLLLWNEGEARCLPYRSSETWQQRLEAETRKTPHA